MSIAVSLHTLAVIIWVGGMFFAYMCLRPVAASVLEPPLRLTLWKQVFDRFFPWVWASVAIVLITGFWIIFSGYGGFAGTRGQWHIHAMMGMGILMMLIYMHVYFAPYRRLK
ncbi:MAG: DUF4149 domain-containing protein, partial [Gammaproteobacteria bacterium]